MATVLLQTCSPVARAATDLLQHGGSGAHDVLLQHGGGGRSARVLFFRSALLLQYSYNTELKADVVFVNFVDVWIALLICPSTDVCDVLDLDAIYFPSFFCSGYSTLILEWRLLRSRERPMYY